MPKELLLTIFILSNGWMAPTLWVYFTQLKDENYEEIKNSS